VPLDRRRYSRGLVNGSLAAGLLVIWVFIRRFSLAFHQLDYFTTLLRVVNLTERS
jgi:hypothetical protein